MKLRTLGTLLAVMFAAGVAQADRVAGMQPPKANDVRKHNASLLKPSVLSGVVTDVGADGDRIQIDNKWYLVKAGRTQFLRAGLPVKAGVLSKGLQVRYSLASRSVGESALGVVYVP